MRTQNEYNVAKQNNRVIHTKIDLLNFKLQKVDELSGVVLDGARFTIDASSDIRRTCSISLIPKDATFDIRHGGKIWMDKYVQIFIGIEDNKNKEIVYTNMGIFIIENPNQTYDAVNNTITINGLDMMARITGLRNGYLEGIEYQVKAKSDIRGAMISAITKEGDYNFVKYIIDEPQPTPLLPNDISLPIGSTLYDVMYQLADINSNYQMYFDIDGTFRYNAIPSGENEQIMIDDDLWKKVLISYNTDINFDNVKNVIEVFGKTLDDGTTPHGYAEEDNPQSPFYIGGSIGKVRIVLNGGEYDNIFNEAQAQERADYELYLRCRLQNQVTLTCVPIYWIDVNWLVEITLPNKQGVEKTEQYIIKSVDTTLGANGTQNISLMKYYPFYP